MTIRLGPAFLLYGHDINLILRIYQQAPLPTHHTQPRRHLPTAPDPDIDPDMPDLIEISDSEDEDDTDISNDVPHVMMASAAEAATASTAMDVASAGEGMTFVYHCIVRRHLQT